MNFDEEIKQHLLWKSTVESLFSTQSNEFALPAVITDDRLCRLGEWIYSNDSASYSSNSAFDQLKKVHKEFHSKAGAILLLYRQEKIQEAEELQDEFYRLSSEVISCLEKLKSQ